MTMALASTRHVQPLLPAPGITPGTRRHRPLFAYGTLEIPAVMRAVVGIELPSVEATLASALQVNRPFGRCLAFVSH